VAAMLNVTIIEDHDNLREVLVELLNQHGFHVSAFDSAEAFVEHIGNRPTDLLIIALNLPGDDGLSFARRIKTVQPDVGIIMTTTRTSSSDRVSGYEAGADIYIPKPFELEELLVAVKVVLRRLGTVLDTRDNRSEIILDTQKQVICYRDRSEQLTSSEVTLLAALARAQQHTLEYWQIFEILGEDLDTASKSNLNVRISRLRGKLQRVVDEQLLLTVRGRGYSLSKPFRISS